MATKTYTDQQVALIKKQLDLENMPTWIVWGYMQEKGINSEEILAEAMRSPKPKEEVEQ
jgi:hypothetical protein